MSSRTLRSEKNIYVVSRSDEKSSRCIKGFQGADDDEARAKACAFAIGQMIAEYDDFVNQHRFDPIWYWKREMMCISQLEKDAETTPYHWDDWFLIRDATIKEPNPLRAYFFIEKFVQCANRLCSVKSPIIKVERIGMA